MKVPQINRLDMKKAVEVCYASPRKKSSIYVSPRKNQTTQQSPRKRRDGGRANTN